MQREYFLKQIGESKEFYKFQEDIRKASTIDRSILLIGERGSGKEFAASRLHYLSSRWKNSFIKLNCAALPPSLIETELFGHVKGAYTGADKERRGRFEEADKGTLFLDEISLIPFEVQEKILRVVEYGTFERVGSSETIEIDVKIIGAANQDLPSLCREGKFKQDLLDRLSFEVLFVPPLRKREEDIIILSNYFAQQMGRELGRRDRIRFTDEVISQLNSYSWPGNIRELKNTVERAVYRTEGTLVEDIILDPFLNPYEDPEKDKVSDADSNRMINNASVAEEEIDIEKLSDPQDPLLKENDISKNILSELFIRILKNTDSEGRGGDRESFGSVDFKKTVNLVKKELLATVLEISGNKQIQAAKLLNLSYDQFRGLYRKYF